jgi:hypothetical protein
VTAGAIPPDPAGDCQDVELRVHPARLVEMSAEQRQTAVRLLVALIDARLARRRATGAPPGEPRPGMRRPARGS